MSTEFVQYASTMLSDTDAEKVVFDTKIFVAPIGQAVPGDQVLAFTTVNDLRDIANIDSGTVVLFDESQTSMLTTFSQNAADFGVEVRAMFGLPDVVYEAWFDNATFGVERVAFGAFVSELRAYKEAREQEALRNESGTDKEAKRYTKKDGSVRYADLSAVSAGEEGVNDDSELD